MRSPITVGHIREEVWVVMRHDPNSSDPVMIGVVLASSAARDSGEAELLAEQDERAENIPEGLGDVIDPDVWFEAVKMPVCVLASGR